MRAWLHKLFNPHCEHCRQEAQEAKICDSCEFLKHEIEVLRMERQDLLEKLFAKNEPAPPAVQQPETLKPILPRHMPWRVRQEMLEREDKERARLLNKEKELDAVARNAIDKHLMDENEKLEREVLGG